MLYPLVNKDGRMVCSKKNTHICVQITGGGLHMIQKLLNLTLTILYLDILCF